MFYISYFFPGKAMIELQDGHENKYFNGFQLKRFWICLKYFFKKMNVDLSKKRL